MSPAAVTDFVAAQREFASRGRAVPGWLKAVRDRSLERFVAVGLPSAHDEEWRFTNLRPVLERRFDLSVPRSTARAGQIDAGTALPIGPRLLFVDGALAGVSGLSALPAGVRVGRLAEAIEEQPRLVEPFLGKWASAEGGAFAALGAAFLADGAFVHVARGTRVQTPIAIVYASERSGHMAHPQSLIVVEAEADVAVAEMYVSAGGTEYLTNATTTAQIGDGARLRHYRMQREDRGAFHLATSRWVLGRDATVESSSVALGGALSRHQLLAVLDGSHGSLTLDGLSILSGSQHGDHHTVIDHAKPHCESHEVFNGVFADDSRGVFNGRIIVRPGAQRTDSKQTSNNLLLSDRARADTQPQLEIYADDVKCTHGATLGPLDETAFFYLLSRGFDRAEARNALTYGFAAEILGRVSETGVRAHFDHLVRAALRDALGAAA